MYISELWNSLLCTRARAAVSEVHILPAHNLLTTHCQPCKASFMPDDGINEVGNSKSYSGRLFAYVFMRSYKIFDN